jgi:hypothetical protein
MNHIFSKKRYYSDFRNPLGSTDEGFDTIWVVEV